MQAHVDGIAHWAMRLATGESIQNNDSMKQADNKPNYILPAVAVAIFNEHGEILLQRRKDTNNWCVISGHVEFGETVEHAVLREIKEETALEATITRLIGIYSSPVSQTYCYEQKNMQYVTSYFEAKLKGSVDSGFSNDETIELRYFSVDGLPEELALMNEHWLSDALDNKGAPHIR